MLSRNHNLVSSFNITKKKTDLSQCKQINKYKEKLSFNPPFSVEFFNVGTKICDLRVCALSWESLSVHGSHSKTQGAESVHHYYKQSGSSWSSL